MHPETNEIGARPERSAPHRVTDALPPGPPPRRKGLLGRLELGLHFALDPIGFVAGRFLKYGDAYYVPGVDGPGLFVFRHPDHVKDVLITEGSKFDKTHSGFENLRELLGDGLLNTDGDVWRRQRRLVQPAFTRERLADYATVMSDEAAREAARLSDGEVLDVATAMMELTLRVVSRTLLGYAAGSGEAENVRQAMGELQTALIGLGLRLPRSISPAHYRIRRAARLMDRTIYARIAERRREPRREAPLDLLQMLLDARDTEGDGGALSDVEIRDQLLTLYLAGHETTSNALTWTFYLLSQNPAAERKLHEEVDRVLGGRAATFADVERLTYADQVVTEAMRLYPPVPVITRGASADAQVGPWRVPKGSEVALWVYQTHHDPRWYPEPWAFRPERWEKDAVAARPKQSYLPFGAGARACIGKVFAQIEAVVVLATLASRVRFELVPGHPVEPQPRITLTPKHGMKMIAHRR